MDITATTEYPEGKTTKIWQVTIKYIPDIGDHILYVDSFTDLDAKAKEDDIQFGPGDWTMVTSVTYIHNPHRFKAE